ncbi:MAG: response regulator [Deltaproteobacteria bacterium]|nr:response regulator [Deltaproteobacteria bacterium]
MKTHDSNILIVEDNQAMRKMLESMLIELGYHNYCAAVNGLKAWDRIQDGDVDIVLSDYLMPEMNGLELLRLIRQTRRFYDMPFIMITGADKRADFMRSIQAEVDYYIIKPPNIGLLEDLLKSVVARQKNPSEFDKLFSNGKYHYLNKEYDEALRHFEMASQARLESALPYYYQGLIYQQLGNEKKAELNFKKSLIIEDQFISSLLALADIYQTREDYANLANCLAKVTEILPDTFDVHIGLARACIRSGDIERARGHLSDAQQLAKNNADQLQEVLDCYIDAGLLDEADLLFGRKVQDDNHEKTIHFLNRLGLRARKMRDFSKAKHFYMNCLRMDPQHKTVNYNLASLLFLQKDYEAAESYLKKIFRLYPDFPEAIELMDAIKQKLRQ